MQHTYTRYLRTTLLLITLLFLTTGLQAQNRTVSISAMNASVKDVFAEVQQKSGYRILYNDEIVPDDLRVTVNAENRSVKEVLDIMFQNTGLAYIMQSEELIVITEKKAKQKNSRITGIVKDALTQESLPYVNVVLSDADSTFAGGVATNEKGVFILDKIVLEEALLTLSMIGYDTRFIKMKGLDGEIDLGELLLVPEVKKLDEVIVESSFQLRSIDRQIYFPTENQRKKSSNGVQLTQRLLLPMVFVNAQTGTISYAGEKDLKILINGMEAVSQEVMALQPQDIIRIDYYDNPGMRYGDNIGLILDYIVKQRTTGGFVSSNLQETLTYTFGNGQLSGGINFGKSQIKLYYYLNHNDLTTPESKRQIFRFPDGNTVSRFEDTDKSHWSETFQMGNMTYTYYGMKNLLSVKTNLFSIYLPYDDDEGNITTLETQETTSFKKRNKENTFRPSLDIYFARQMKNDQTVAVNIVGTQNKNIVDYGYNETLNGESLSDIETYVDGKRRSFIGEIFYEKKFPVGSFSAGLRHTQGITKNRYTGDSNFETNMNDATSYGFTQYKGAIGKFGYMGGMGISRTYYKQEGVDDTYDKWTASPMMSIDYKFSPVISIRYSYQLKNINPQLSLLSDVERARNGYQLSQGNPALHSYLRHDNEIRINMNPSPINSSLSLISSYYDNPIMEQTYYDTSRNLFVTTYDNQRLFHQLKLQYNIQASFFNDHLSINGYGGYNSVVSQGNHYRHKRNEWFYVLQTIGDYKKWSLTVTLVHLAKPFWGETVQIGHSYNEYIISRRLPWGELGATSFCLFGEKNKSYSYNYNESIGYKQTNFYSTIRPSFGIYGSINLNWGKQNKGATQKLSNSDSESGIL